MQCPFCGGAVAVDAERCPWCLQALTPGSGDRDLHGYDTAYQPQPQVPADAPVYEGGGAYGGYQDHGRPRLWEPPAPAHRAETPPPRIDADDFSAWQSSVKSGTVERRVYTAVPERKAATYGRTRPVGLPSSSHTRILVILVIVVALAAAAWLHFGLKLF